jgi:putative peptide zinc metalloprotease protein
MSEQSTILPPLRQELQIRATSRAENGAPRWTIYDPIRHQYHVLSFDGFTIFKHWQTGLTLHDFIAYLEGQQVDVDITEVEELLEFLAHHELVDISLPNPENKHSSQANETLLERELKAKKSSFNKLLHGYLFFKIPLLKPEPWIGILADKLQWLRSSWVSYSFMIIALSGLYQVIQQWDKFTTTFSNLLNTQGFILFLLCLTFLKICHEFGHAIACKWRGCHVGSMGLAFLVLFPIMYTDTTDSWRLTKRSERLSIVTAGLRVELKIAALALFIWGVSPPGLVKSLCFIIFTSGVISSLLVNLSPFMRFDGYFAMSDALKMPNLQNRAFAIARWCLRYYVIGIRENIPEPFSPKFILLLLFYAYGTWIYRFFLFLGIAIFVYRIDFKLLGIFLFAVEIYYFIARPIISEAKIWWEKRSKISITKSNLFALSLFLLGLAWLFVPNLNPIRLPAVATVEQKVKIFPPRTGALNLRYPNKQFINKGDVVAVITPYGFTEELNIAKLSVLKAQKKVEILTNSSMRRGELSLAITELNDALNLLTQTQQLLERNKIKSSFDGVWIPASHFSQGQYVSHETELGSIYNQQQLVVLAYATHSQKEAITTNQMGELLLDNGDSFIVKIHKAVSEVAETSITKPSLVSTYSERILVRPVQDKFIPEVPVYRVFAISEHSFPYPSELKGTLILNTHDAAPIIRFYRWFVSSLLAETGF